MARMAIPHVLFEMIPSLESLATIVSRTDRAGVYFSPRMHRFVPIERVTSVEVLAAPVEIADVDPMGSFFRMAFERVQIRERGRTDCTPVVWFNVCGDAAVDCKDFSFNHRDLREDVAYVFQLHRL